MNASNPLLILSFGSEEVSTLSELARAIGYADAQLAIGGVAEAVTALDGRASAPEHIIIDIGSRGKDVLSDIDEIALHCEPSVSVMVIGSVNDISFYRELKQRGILEYFPRPALAADVRAVLLQGIALRQQALANASVHGTVITCMSAASGDGASTLAANLSYCLAEEHKHSTVLVDMDYQFGLIAKSLDLTAPFGIRELFDYPDRGLDNILVEKMLVRYGEKLKIISTPGELQILPPIRPEAIRDLINILRSKFSFVIIDVPHIWTHWTAAALKHADHNILVGQLWLRSLTHATRLLTAWQNAGIAREHVSLIINRSGAKFKEAISAEEFERICHHKIEAHLNNDIKAVVQAENQGKTIYETADEGSLLQQQIKQIALSLMERFHVPVVEENTLVPVETSAKKGLKSLFDKKPRT